MPASSYRPPFRATCLSDGGRAPVPLTTAGCTPLAPPQVLGPTSPQVAGTLADLGRVLAKLRRFDEADKAYLSSLDIFDRYDLPEHTAAVFNNLGRMYTKQRNYPAAETVLRRSIAILEQLESAGHRGVGRELAAALTSMAIIAPHAEAGPLYRRVLPMREAMYGLQHPEYAAALNNLGSWLQVGGGFGSLSGRCALTRPD